MNPVIGRRWLARVCLSLAVVVCLISQVERGAANEPVLGEKAPPKYDLKYTFHPGEIVRTQVDHRVTVETSIQGTSQTAETRSTSVKVWRISDVTPEGQITFMYAVESVDMWQHTQGRQEVRYNSAADKDVPAEYEAVAKAIGVPLTVITMDRTGKVLKREEKLHQPNPNSLPIAVVLPAQGVAVGETWTAPLELDVRQAGGAITKIKARNRYRLEKVTDGVATIQVDSQILTPVRDPAIEVQLAQRLPSGSIRFDISAGRVVSQQMDLDKRVIGFSGASSSMHCLMRVTEELLPPRAQSAGRLPKVAAKKDNSSAGEKGSREPRTATRPKPAAR